jgi:hypothetical protein
LNQVLPSESVRHHLRELVCVGADPMQPSKAPSRGREVEVEGRKGEHRVEWDPQKP